MSEELMKAQLPHCAHRKDLRQLCPRSLGCYLQIRIAATVTVTLAQLLHFYGGSRYDMVVSLGPHTTVKVQVLRLDVPVRVVCRKKAKEEYASLEVASK